MKRLGTAILAIGWMITLAAGSGGEVPEPPDLSGSWELNEERSDDPAKKVDEAMRGRREPPGARGVRGRAPGSPADAKRALREQLEALVDWPRVITIDHLEPEMTIESALPDRPFRRTLYSDSRPFAWGGASGEAVASWRRGGRLVLELSTASDRSVEETWELVAEGSRILVATEIAAKGLQPAIRVQRVYDRVEIVPWAIEE